MWKMAEWVIAIGNVVSVSSNGSFLSWKGFSSVACICRSKSSCQTTRVGCTAGFRYQTLRCARLNRF